MDNLLFVVTHKMVNTPKILPYKSIGVGSEKSILQTDLRDDYGENIAEKNANYCELTAQYWVWKNCAEQFDNIGLCHYRRYFAKSKLQRRTLLDDRTLSQYLKKADIILPTRWYWRETVYEHYFKHGYGKEHDLCIAKAVIKDLFPEYLVSFNTIMNSGSASYCNMFIAKRQLFEQYNTWLFQVLAEVEKRIDISSYSKQEARVYGYLSELLLNVWVLKNQLTIKYLPIIETELNIKKMVLNDIKRAQEKIFSLLYVRV